MADHLNNLQLSRENIILELLFLLERDVSELKLHKLLFLAMFKEKIIPKFFLYFPYLHGPYSSDLSKELLKMCRRGLVTIRKFKKSNSIVKLIQLTQQGKEIGETLWQSDL
ncbi:MAG: hypothetical protein ACTSQM_05530, partial [Candidatus Odinarchaeia archaeon]